MNQTFYNIVIFVCAVVIGGIVILFSIRPQDEGVKAIGFKNEKVWSKVALSSENNSYKVKLEPVNIKGLQVSKNTPMLVEFGRLSTFTYLAPSDNQESVFAQSGTTGIIIGDAPGIISLYDLFLSYTIYDKDDKFRLEQITNGSFYIGKEGDGKIAIYSIDGVLRLNLLHEGKYMTNLILFPGSYIRFDPSRNRSLENADLFRTILSLDESDNEVFEYVNPRVNIGDDQDTFFNYRLPKESINLFRILSARFQESVNQVNQIRRNYITYAYSNTEEESKWLYNPSKKNHNLLIELSTLLSSILENSGNAETKIQKIGQLYSQTKELKMKESTAKSLVEQFLLDGRFAQYGGNSGQKYQQIYEDIAKMIGIERTDAKSKLYQNLADIYSKNLFMQKRSDVTTAFINTYGPTSSELEGTFSKNEIPKKDYFDIAIYAYNILRKVEDKPKLLPLSALEDLSTYSYLMTFFQASNRYIESVTDIDDKQKTIVSFSRQFYDYILSLVVNSLYTAYIVEEDGLLFLDERFREGDQVRISEEVVDKVNTFFSTVDAVTTTIQSLWVETEESDGTIFRRIKTNLARLRAFTNIINPDDYKNYVNTPFLADTGSTTDIKFPVIDESSGLGIRLDSSIVEKIKNTKKLATDPRIQELKKIWPDADSSSWILEGDDIRVIRAPYKIGRSGAGNSSVDISALYKDKTFADGIIYYDGYQMRVVTEDPMSLQIYKSFLLQLESYLDFIDKEIVGFSEANEEIGEIAIFPIKQRISIGESLYSIDVNQDTTDE